MAGGRGAGNPLVKAALCGLLKEEFGAPVPWEQLGELRLRHVGDAGEDVGEPSLRINVVELGGLCRLPNYAERVWEEAAVCARLRPAERASPQFHSA
jgi:hypothetical protein